MNFEILIDHPFSEICLDQELNPRDNKHVLSLINKYEDGKWRFDRFQNFIWDNIKETALSQRERVAMLSYGEGSMISEAAKNLRLVEAKDAVGRGSEIAEIVLYGIMKNYYRALPVVPKIFYKENRNDEAKGADSIHIVIDSEESFSLWFGESKFYNNIENTRLDTIVESVKSSISLDKIKKENSLITNVGDIEDFDEISEQLREKIKKSLSQSESIDSIKPILHIPILLLYECQITKHSTSLTEEYKNNMINYHKDRAESYFKKQIEKCSTVHMYDHITFHIILFPVADKARIVDKFISIAKVYRDE
ncbi:DUF1837 domain-containing protein [Sphingobacterium sp.]|uniref:HamA C-terminal domain-containing protein n=1 Tax=Sphingobacterium sp. TaxID=341027 RepID=UPI002896A66D|nr:DUF1837 domain-containing protein [Sphingobacterium sp.]